MTNQSTVNTNQTNFTSFTNLFDSQPITQIAAQITNNFITITSPAVGKHYLKTWDITEDQATGAVAANNYLEYGLSDYQARAGYNLNRQWDYLGTRNNQFRTFHGQTPATVSGQTNTGTLFPVISPRFRYTAPAAGQPVAANTPANITPDPLDFSITDITGEITQNDNITYKKIHVQLLTEDDEVIQFKYASGVNMNQIVDVITIDIPAGATTWTVDLPPLLKPYFGVAEISAYASYELLLQSPMQTPNSSPQMSPVTLLTSTPIKRQIVLLGLQLGSSNGATENTHTTENLVTDFSDANLITSSQSGTALGRFRTRRLQVLTGDNASRSIFWQNYDGNWAAETRSAPRMPTVHLETQIIGLSENATHLIYEHYLDTNTITQAPTPAQVTAIKTFFKVTSNWTTEYSFSGGARRSAAGQNNFATYSYTLPVTGSTSCELYAPPNTTGTAAGFLQSYEHNPVQPPAAEATVATQAYRDRHWMQYDNPTPQNPGNWDFEYESATIPWQPSTGYWVNNTGATQNATTGNIANLHYIQKIRGGDIMISAVINLFGVSYTLYLPTLRVEAAYPTVADLDEVLTQAHLTAAVNLIPNTFSPARTALAPAAAIPVNLRTRREKANTVLTELTHQTWLTVCKSIIWKESGSRLPNNGNPDPGDLVYQFKRKRTQYNIATYRGTVRTYFESFNQPNFGYPGGWSLGQFDDPPPTDEIIWHWDHAVSQVLRFLTETKLVDSFSSHGVNARGTSGIAYHVNLAFANARNDYTQKVGCAYSATQGTGTRNGAAHDYYSNLVRCGVTAVEDLYNGTANERSNAANVIAWNAMRYYNGPNYSISYKYPYLVGQFSGLQADTPYFIGIATPARGCIP